MTAPGAPPCALCRGADGDHELGRVEVWADPLWRLTTSIGPGDVTAGFSYLEPRRHIGYVTDLGGEEATTFGVVLARCCRALQAATNAELVYVYIFGGHIEHLHVHLAPHSAGDALNDVMIKGRVDERPHPSGAVSLVSRDFAEVPSEVLASVAQRVAQKMAT